MGEMAPMMSAALLDRSSVSSLCVSSRGERRAVVTRAGSVQEGRPMWLPGVSSPPHLDGSMQGDSGFDPLGLGANPDRLKWYQEAELMNGRFAMIGALGIMGGEVLGAYKDVTWYEAGAKGYDIPILPLVAVQAVVMGFLETKRYQGFKNTGLSGGLIDDQPFDPAKLLTEKSKLQEVKNARLAMVAMFGFAGQAACTPGVGPIQNLTDHLANPFGCNIITNVLTIQDHLADLGFAKGVAAVAEAAAEAAAEAGAVVEAAAQ